jgi:thioredoxin-related protein
MKNKIVLSFLLLLATIVNVSAQEWLTDFDEAKKVAAAENRHIVLVFEGSDWCAPCIKLNKEVWTTETFTTYADDNFVMLLADFPRRKQNKLDEQQQEQNNRLAEKYNHGGYFPLVVVLDETGKVLGETGYNRMDVNEYIDLLASY